ncbi:hypothetical protein [Devosia sp. 66-22]|uniref:hypothetical protein n=1 Tax=Devosia sp. 66-22 TaxID=1895753 RepID=UPI0026106A67|nr:hypothetical protein [Devosia sp. 66-22]
MAKASGTTAKAYREMSLGSRRATSQMQEDAIRSTLRINQALDATRARVGVFASSFASGLVAPLAGLLSLTAAVNGTRAALDKFGDIADQSAAAGLDSEFFQGIAYQAKLSGIEIGTMADAMATFNKLSGQAVEGRGKMVTQLKAEHPELLRSLQLATDQEQRFRLIVDAIKNAKTEQEGAVIAAAAWGDQGVRIATAFREGSAAVDEMVRKAKELGLIVDREVIARADELGDEWETTAAILDNRIKVALVDMGPLMVDLVGLAADFGSNMALVHDQFREIEQRRFLNPLQNELIAVQEEIHRIKTGGERGGVGAVVDLVFGKSGDEDARVEELYQKAERLQERIAQLQGKPPGPPTAAPVVRSPGSAFSQGWGAGAFLSSAPQVFDRKLIDGLKDVSGAAYKTTVELASTTDAVDELRQQAEQTATALESSLGGALSTLFDGPITNVQDGLAGILDSLGSLGRQNLSSVFSGMLSPANQNAATGGVMGNGLWGSAIFEAAKAGTAAGSKEGVAGGFDGWLKNNAGTVGAGLGGLGLGYSTQSPLMGAVGGALGGAAAGPWGALAGGVAGFIGGLLGMQEALQKAKKAVNDNKLSIDQFIATGMGKEVDSISAAVAQFRAQGAQLVELAKAAGDNALVRRLQRAMDAYRDTLRIERLQDRVVASSDVLREAYEREADALRGVIEQNKAWVASLKGFKNALLLDTNLSPLSPQDRLIQAQMQFQRTSQAAIGGDASAQSRLQQEASSYLEAARGFYASSGAYQSIFDQVQGVLDRAISAGNGAVSDAERQLNKLTDLVGGQIDLKNAVVSVNQAIAKLNADMARLQAAEIAASQDVTTSVKQLLRELSQQSGRRAA